jgi:hypothetical protein
MHGIWREERYDNSTLYTAQVKQTLSRVLNYHTTHDCYTMRIYKGRWEIKFAVATGAKVLSSLYEFLKNSLPFSHTENRLKYKHHIITKSAN